MVSNGFPTWIVRGVRMHTWLKGAISHKVERWWWWFEIHVSPPLCALFRLWALVRFDASRSAFLDAPRYFCEYPTDEHRWFTHPAFCFSQLCLPSPYLQPPGRDSSGYCRGGSCTSRRQRFIATFSSVRAVYVRRHAQLIPPATYSYFSGPYCS